MLKGKNVIIRTAKENELEKYFELITKIDVNDEFMFYPFRSFERMKKEFSETGGFLSDKYSFFFITDMEGRIIGDLEYFLQGENIGTGYGIGYDIFNPKDRGKGYMTEALKMMSSYLFDYKKIERLGLLIMENNIPSQRVAEKCGYIKEGIVRKGAFHKGKYWDYFAYSLLREECPTLKEVLGL